MLEAVANWCYTAYTFIIYFSTFFTLVAFVVLLCCLFFLKKGILLQIFLTLSYYCYKKKLKVAEYHNDTCTILLFKCFSHNIWLVLANDNQLPSSRRWQKNQDFTWRWEVYEIFMIVVKNMRVDVYVGKTTVETVKLLLLTSAATFNVFE